MSLISERNHENRLKKLNINIKTIYSDGDKKYIKNTDNSYNDDIIKGIRIEKDYYINNKLIKKLYGFDPRIEYSYIKGEQIGSEYDCPNCRMKTVITENIEQCPFCGSYMNLDYLNKDLGSKNTYDYVLHSKLYIVLTLIFDLLISFGISFLYFHKVSRTFNTIDIIKASGVALAIALVLFFIFYLIDGLIVTIPIRIKKSKINNNDKKVWKDLYERHISSTTFYNNFHYELDRYYYTDNTNVIDYDIIDYYNFKYGEDASYKYISLDALIRVVSYEKNSIKDVTKPRKLVFVKSSKPITYTEDGKINMINCHNCGASIDVTSEKCSYCDTHNNYNQEWYLQNNKK